MQRWTSLYECINEDWKIIALVIIIVTLLSKRIKLMPYNVTKTAKK